MTRVLLDRVEATVILEGFAGPGGWSQGLRYAGYTGPAVGIELDMAACRTAQAAGHQRIQADVATFPLGHLAGRVDGLIMSPPCTPWSAAGDRKGEQDRPAVHRRLAAFAAGDTPEQVEWADDQSPLAAEPMRYAYALMPRWIACEQVPPALELWQHTAIQLRGLGYHTWCGLLSAEMYGVPQTRLRAVLIARRDGLPVGPPAPTNQRYVAGRDPNTEPDLFGDPLPPPVSMAEALGWGVPTRPAWTVTSGGTESGGGVEVFAYAEARRQIAEAVRAGGEVVMRNGSQANACERRASEPAGTLFFGGRTNAVDWVMRSNYTDHRNESGRGERHPDEPAATITGKAKGAKWVRQTERQANGGDRSIDDPSLTIMASHDNGNLRWTNEARMHPAGVHGSYGYSRPVSEPSPTIKGGGSGGQYIADGEQTARVTVQEAGILQSFPPDYPWSGNKSQQYQQCGNAVPPLLSAAILRPLIVDHEGRCAA